MFVEDFFYIFTFKIWFWY